MSFGSVNTISQHIFKRLFVSSAAYFAVIKLLFANHKETQ